MALVAAAVLSPLALSWAPVILLAWYLYQWRWPVSRVVTLLTHYFLFFALGLLFSMSIPALLSPLVSLPILALLTHSLEKAALTIKYRPIQRKSLTGASMACIVMALIALLISLALTNLTLIAESLLALVYFAGMALYVFWRLPLKPLEDVRIQVRVLAGKEEAVQVQLKPRTKIAGLLYIQPTQDWTSVRTGLLPLQSVIPPLKMTVAPSLSGNQKVRLMGYAIDRWGLVQSRFEFEPVEVLAIPRARYATWLAKKYLSGTKPGALPLLSSLSMVAGQRGLRRGLEYYGNRFYQPGDSLKNVSWKHSSKYNELIIKQFTEFQGQPAIMLINLTAGSAAEADRLAYNFIMTAITLIQERIPAALAAYNQEKVVITTGQLARSPLLLHCLHLVKEIQITENQLRYLSPPDVYRLRANLRQVARVDSKPARILAGLLEMEYRSLNANAEGSPCTRALADVAAKVNSKATVIVISGNNHDAEALAFNNFLLTRKGNSVISLS